MNNKEIKLLVVLVLLLAFSVKTYSADIAPMDPTEKKAKKEVGPIDPDKPKEIGPLEMDKKDTTTEKKSKDSLKSTDKIKDKAAAKETGPVDPMKPKEAKPLELGKTEKKSDEPLLLDRESIKKTDAPLLLDKGDSKKTDAPLSMDNEPGKKGAESTDTKSTTSTAKGKEKPKPTGNMTEEIYVELLANMQIIGAKYNIEKNPKAVDKVSAEMEAISAKFKVNSLDFNEWNKKVMKDPKMYNDIMMKVAKKIELMQRFER